MDEHERGHSAPPATHWNVTRDPIESFACPRCGHRVELAFVYRPPDHFEEVIASCEVCKIALHAADWQAAKTENVSEEW